MKKNLHLILVGAAVLLVLASQSLYIVQQPEQAIVLQFGNPVRLIQEPGLKIKMPFIQNVVFYDRRLLNLEPPAGSRTERQKAFGCRYFFQIQNC